MPNLFRRVWAAAHLDAQVLPTLLFRGWSTIAGASTVLILALRLTPVQQGYYYTIASVLALQVFFELGLNQVLMQLVSHEAAHLTQNKDGRLVGGANELGKLASLARMLSRWYAVAALLFSVLGGLGGGFFFVTNSALPIREWLGIWCVVIIATAVNLWLSPGLAVMEGCGKTGEVARHRLSQSVLGYIGLWTLLCLDAGLWAVVAVPVVSAICTFRWLVIHGTTLQWLKSLTPDESHKLSWSVDVFPLQWRIALSWASGYFIYYIFTPILFAAQGAIEAGRFGMAMTVFSAASTLGMSWVNAKAPFFTMHISRNERSTLNELFKNTISRAILVTAALCGGFVVGAWLLTLLQVGSMARLPSLGVLVVLAIVAVANCAVSAAAIYMRAHRQEPMLTISVVTGCLTALCAYFGAQYNMLVMSLLYAAVITLVMLPWTAWLLAGYYKKASSV